MSSLLNLKLCHIENTIYKIKVYQQVTKLAILIKSMNRKSSYTNYKPPKPLVRNSKITQFIIIKRKIKMLRWLSIPTSSKAQPSKYTNISSNIRYLFTFSTYITNVSYEPKLSKYKHKNSQNHTVYRM